MKKNYLLLLAAGIIQTMFILGSCSTGENGIFTMLGGRTHALLFLGSRAVSEEKIEFEFSQPVTITKISFEPHLSISSIEDGSTVRVTLEEAIKPGIMVNADILAEDENRNTINVLVSFRSRNDRMPELVINEIRTENSNPRAEFIEFKMRTDGNLGAMRVFILGNTNASRETIYEFRPVEVKKDDYVVLHLRTVEDSARDEYNGRKDESGGRDASPEAWDFWIPGNSKRIHREASVIYVLDQDDKVITGVMISNESSAWWGKDYFAEAAIMLHNQGAWKSRDGGLPGPADAIRSLGTTNTRTLNRDERVPNTNTNADWYVTVTSGVTAGRPNNPGRHPN
ncbi:MAG: hypothetical protein LBC80_04705 [Treponema sp.]|jgi:hypothetical protein|nr:hypothetical protein [Treponema sp.]